MVEEDPVLASTHGRVHALPISAPERCALEQFAKVYAIERETKELTPVGADSKLTSYAD